MAEKKNITRAQALTNAIGYAKGCGDYATAEVLGNMLAQVTKPRKAAVSKARKANEYLASVIVKQMPADGMTSKEIVAIGLPDVATTQKAAAVMRVAEELGLVAKIKDGKKISYKPVADEEQEDE